MQTLDFGLFCIIRRQEINFRNENPFLNHLNQILKIEQILFKSASKIVKNHSHQQV